MPNFTKSQKLKQFEKDIAAYYAQNHDKFKSQYELKDIVPMLCDYCEKKKDIAFTILVIYKLNSLSIENKIGLIAGILDDKNCPDISTLINEHPADREILQNMLLEIVQDNRKNKKLLEMLPNNKEILGENLFKILNEPDYIDPKILADKYKLLGLQPGASLAAVKKAYRDKSVKYHPDKNPNVNTKENKKNKEFSQAINEAYDVLTEALKNQETQHQNQEEQSTQPNPTQTDFATSPPPTSPASSKNSTQGESDFDTATGEEAKEQWCPKYTNYAQRDDFDFDHWAFKHHKNQYDPQYPTSTFNGSGHIANMAAYVENMNKYFAEYHPQFTAKFVDNNTCALFKDDQEFAKLHDLKDGYIRIKATTMTPNHEEIAAMFLAMKMAIPEATSYEAKNFAEKEKAFVLELAKLYKVEIKFVDTTKPENKPDHPSPKPSHDS